MTRLLVVTAVAAERDAVLRRFDDVHTSTLGAWPVAMASSPAGEIVVVAGGVGMAAAAAATAGLCTTAFRDGERFGAVVGAGIGGGFDGRAEVGSVVMASRVVAADLGADTPDGFRSLAELGLHETTLYPVADVEALGRRLGAVVGTVISVNTVTGTDVRAAYLGERWDAVAEGMEGYGVWLAAPDNTPRFELRAISNRVGRRDRPSWDIAGALAALGDACFQLFEESLS